MKYRGFVISPVYFVGSDFTVKNGIIKERKQTKKDIEYYEVLDPLENDNRYCAEFTIQDCKNAIDSLLAKLGMKTNSVKEWKRLSST